MTRFEPEGGVLVADLSTVLLATLVALGIVVLAVLGYYLPQSRTETITCFECRRNIVAMKSLPKVTCSGCQTVLKQDGQVIIKGGNGGKESG